MARVSRYGRDEWERIREERRMARNLRILSLIAEGHTDKEIAVELHYAFDTIREYMKQIMWDFDARNRTHAVVQAMRAGLLPVNGEGEDGA